MILPFSTQLDGKPTYFIEKIWTGLLGKKFNLLAYHRFKDEAAYDGVIDQWDYKKSLSPKIHTIREDKKERWKPGTKIDFFINCRQKNMFRFAPVLPVVRVQRVFMTYLFNDIIEISINGRQLHQPSQLLEFAINDGFASWTDFFNYFYPKIIASENEEYHAKIIHWTDLKY